MGHPKIYISNQTLAKVTDSPRSINEVNETANEPKGI